MDTVAPYLRERFGARHVRFLFVDVVGRRVVRVTEEAAPQRGRGADLMPLAGSIYDGVLRTQKLVREPHPRWAQGGHAGHQPRRACGRKKGPH
ncbi:hypothetical protein ACFWNU_31990, partial [Streptomyces sp. NPDC058427]